MSLPLDQPYHRPFTVRFWISTGASIWSKPALSEPHAFQTLAELEQHYACDPKLLGWESDEVAACMHCDEYYYIAESVQSGKHNPHDFCSEECEQTASTVDAAAAADGITTDGDCDTRYDKRIFSHDSEYEC